MAIYTVEDTLTKRQVTFDWSDPATPTDQDMEQIFIEARQVKPETPAPTGLIVPGNIDLTIKPTPAPVSTLNQGHVLKSRPNPVSDVVSPADVFNPPGGLEAPEKPKGLVERVMQAANVSIGGTAGMVTDYIASGLRSQNIATQKILNTDFGTGAANDPDEQKKIEAEMARRAELATHLEKTAANIMADIPAEHQQTVNDANNYITSKEALKLENIWKTIDAAIITTASQAANIMSGVNPLIGIPTLIASEGGNFIQQARQSGVDDPEIIAKYKDAYAAPSGVIEYAMESFLLGPAKAALKLPGLKNLAHAAEKEINKRLIPRVLKIAGKDVGKSVMEGVEEFTQAELQDWVTGLALGDMAKKYPVKAQYYADQAAKLKLPEHIRSNIAQGILGVVGGGVTVAGARTVSVAANAAAQQREAPQAPEAAPQPAAAISPQPQNAPIPAKAPGKTLQREAPQAPEAAPQPAAAVSPQPQNAPIPAKAPGKTLQQVGISSVDGYYKLPADIRNKIFPVLSELEQDRIVAEYVPTQEEINAGKEAPNVQVQTMTAPAPQQQPVAPPVPAAPHQEITPNAAAPSIPEGSQQQVAQPEQKPIEQPAPEAIATNQAPATPAAAEGGKAVDFGPVKVPEEQIDYLTQLPNNTVTKKHIADIPVDSKTTTVSIDADHFKAINDTFGHAAGDKVLIQLGTKINQYFPNKMRGREGGEELFVDLGENPTPQEFENVKQFQADVEQNVKTPNGEPVTVSIGIGTGKYKKKDGTFGLASDHSAYKAKEHGRNQIAIDNGRNIAYTIGRGTGKKHYLTKFARKQVVEYANLLSRDGDLDPAAAARIVSEIRGNETQPPGSGPGTQPVVSPGPEAPTAVAAPAVVRGQPVLGNNAEAQARPGIVPSVVSPDQGKQFIKKMRQEAVQAFVDGFYDHTDTFHPGKWNGWKSDVSNILGSKSKKNEPLTGKFSPDAETYFQTIADNLSKNPEQQAGAQRLTQGVPYTTEGIKKWLMPESVEKTVPSVKVPEKGSETPPATSPVAEQAPAQTGQKPVEQVAKGEQPAAPAPKQPAAPKKLTYEEAEARAMAMPETYTIDTPERKKLREDIAKEIYGAGAKNKDKKAIMIMGLSGSGKSTTAKEINKDFGGIILDIDDIKAKLPEYENGVGSMATYRESVELMENKIVPLARKAGDNIIIPGTGKSLDKVQIKIDALKADGYSLKVIYVKIDPAVAKKRTKDRFEAGGIWIPYELIDENVVQIEKNYGILKVEGRADEYEERDGQTGKISRGPVSGEERGGDHANTGRRPGRQNEPSVPEANQVKEKVSTPPKEAPNELERKSPKPLEGIPAANVPGPVEERAVGTGAAEGVGQRKRGDIGTGEQRGPETARSARNRPAAVYLPETGERTAEAGRESSGDRHPLPSGVTENERRTDDHSNYHITDEDHIGVGGIAQKFSDNIAAIKTLKEIESQNRMATPAEQAILVKYVGWGGMPQAFDQRNAEWTQKRAELKTLLTADEHDAANTSIVNAHFTSPVAIRGMWSALTRMGFTGGTVFEPGCGIGHFFGLRPESANMTYTGIEMDALTARIARQLYQSSNIHDMPFEEFSLLRDSNTIAIGNVPFSGKIFPYDRESSRYGMKARAYALHDFFFLKTLYGVKPGGLVAFISSRYTMDKQNVAMRTLIAERADFIGAIRLPANAFKGNANTEVVTDIIFLQKRAPGVAMSDRTKQFIETDKVTYPLVQGEGTKAESQNKYFIEHPEMILGKQDLSGTMYAGNQYNVTLDPSEIESSLQAAVEKLPANIMRLSDEGAAKQKTELEKSLAPVNLSEGSYYIEKGKLWQKTDFNAETKEEGQESKKIGILVSGTPEKLNRIKGMVQVKVSAKKLLAKQFETEGDEEIAPELKTLNSVYDAFIKKYGYLSAKNNVKVMEDDPEAPLLLALENWDRKENTATKADIFSKRTIFKKPEIKSAGTPEEAMLISLSDRGTVDWDWMAQLTGKGIKELQKSLAAKGLVFEDAEQFLRDGTVDFKTREDYLSGNVRWKLKQAEEAQEKDKRFSKNIEELKRVIPKDLDNSEIYVRMNAPFLLADDIKSFMMELLDLEGRQISIGHSRELGKWYVDSNISKWVTNPKVNEEFGTKDLNAIKIINMLLNNKNIEVVRKDAQGKKFIDMDASDAAKGKAEEIVNAFNDWIWKDAGRTARIVRDYNDRFNASVDRSFKHPLRIMDEKAEVRLPGCTYTLRPHQADAVYRNIQTKNTMLAHAVGSGKTLEMICTAMEMRRMGIRKKPMIVIPNHMTEQWANDFRRAYPGAKVLVATEKIFKSSNPERRKTFLNRIATGDWDAVIVRQSHFLRIPMSKKARKEYIEGKKAIYKAALDLAKDDGDRITEKDLRARLKNYEGKIESLADSPEDKGVIPFEQLGVDELFVDEADLFKNVDFFTQRNVLGLGTQTGAEKSTDLMMKIKLVQNAGGGVVFATGTPISNSMTETYHMMRYLQPETLAKMGLENFDEWANAYGQEVESWELNNSGSGYKLRRRFSKFVNVPELMTELRQAWDIQTGPMLEKAGILVRGENLPMPVYKTVSVPSTPALKSFIQYLKEEEKHATKETGGVLTVIGKGRKAAVDMRLINSSLEDNPDYKLNRVIDLIKKLHDQYGKENLAGLVFYDLTQPDQGERFSPHNEIKNKLVAMGVPADEIAFIHDADSDTKKLRLFDNVNTGKVKILIGSTEKMGAGTNVQHRLKWMVEIDAPWRPRDVEQREGRIIRQGNSNKEVLIFRTVTQGSYDVALWSLLDIKSKVIQQVMSGEDKATREMDDGASFSSVMLMAVDNPLVKESMELDQEVKKLNAIKKNWIKQTTDARAYLSNAPEKISEYESTMESIQKDIKTAGAAPKEFEGIVAGKKYTERKEFGQAVLKIFNKERSGRTNEWILTDDIGEIGGLPFYIQAQYQDMGTGDAYKFLNGLVGGIKIRGSKLIYPANISETPHIIAMNASDALWGKEHGLSPKVEGYKADIEKVKKNSEEYERIAKKPFDGEKRFVEAKKRLDDVMAEIVKESEKQKTTEAEGIKGPDWRALEAGRHKATEETIEGEGAAGVSLLLRDINEGFLPRAITQKTVETLARGYFGKSKIIRVIDNEKELSQGLQEYIASRNASGQVKAVFEKRTNTIYMLANMFSTPQEFIAGMKHEVQHFGLRELLGDQIKPVYEAIFKKYENSDVGRRILSDYFDPETMPFDPKSENDRYLFADEVLASLAQNNRDPGFFAGIVARIRELLRKAFPNMEWTDADVRALISRSAQRARQAAETSAMYEGQPMFMRARKSDEERRQADESKNLPIDEQNPDNQKTIADHLRQIANEKADAEKFKADLNAPNAADEEMHRRAAAVQEDTKVMRDADAAEQEIRKLKGKLLNVAQGNVENRAVVENLIANYKDQEAEKLRTAIIQYAKAIGLIGEPNNMVAGLVRDATTLTRFKKALRIMDDVLEKRQKTRLFDAVSEQIVKEEKRLSAIKGKTVSTTDLESNRALRAFLDGLQTITPAGRDYLNKTLAYLNEYSAKDIKQNRDQFISDLDEQTINWLEDPTANPVPENLKKAMDDFYRPTLQDMNSKQLALVLQDIFEIKATGRIRRKQAEIDRKNNLLNAAGKTAVLVDAITKQRKNVMEKALEVKSNNKLIRTFERLADLTHDTFFGLIDAERLVEGFTDFLPSPMKTMVFDKIYRARAEEFRGMEGVLKGIQERHKGINWAQVKDRPFTTIKIEREDKKTGDKTTSDIELTLNQMMFVYANSQNSANRMHLNGTGFDDAAVEAIIQALPQQYQDAVDAQINYYDKEQYNRVNPSFIAEHQIDMPKEDRYFPIQNLETDKAESAQTVDLLARMGARKQFIAKGFTKQRIMSAAPFSRLDYIGTILNNAVMTEHYVAMSQAIREVNQFLNQKELKAALKDKNKNAYTHLRKWVDAMAYGKIGTSEYAWDKWVGFLRKNYVAYQLGLKATSILMQMGSIPKGLAMTNPARWAVELAAFSKNPVKVWKFVNEASPYMKNRMNDYERELAEYAEKNAGKNILGIKKTDVGAAWEKTQESTLWFMGALDKSIAVPLWMSKYREVLNAIGDEKQAIYEADMLVRKTQSGGGLITLPSLYRGGELMRSFSIFTSDMSKTFNMLYELAGRISRDMKYTPGKGNIPEFEKDRLRTTFQIAAATFIIAPMLTYALGHGFRLPWEDPEGWAKETIKNISGGIPILGQILDAIVGFGADKVKELRGGKPNKFWVEYTKNIDIPPFLVLEKMIDAIATGKIPKIVDAMAMILGIPYSQINRTRKGMKQVAETKDWRYAVWSEQMLRDPSIAAAMAERAKNAGKWQEKKKLLDWFNKMPEEKRTEWLKKAERVTGMNAGAIIDRILKYSDQLPDQPDRFMKQRDQLIDKRADGEIDEAEFNEKMDKIAKDEKKFMEAFKK
jgi:diguanylate cyclase (GGDEF)-like protein